MSKRSRFRAPRVLQDFAATLRALRDVQDSLDDISRGRAELAMNLRSFNLVAGNFHRASAPAAGMQARLPKASGENLGDAITLHLEGMLGALSVFAAPGDTVNGLAQADFTDDGVVVLWSNGVNAWSGVAQLPANSPSGSALDAQYVLGAAHASLPNGAVATDTSEINVTITPGTTATWALIDGSIGLPRFANIAAGTFLGNVTGSSGPVTANSLTTLAGGGLTYSLGVMAVGAGTRITVNANDVQLAAGAAESFLGNFTSGSAVADYRAGSSVAGAGLAYAAGGTLNVGAGTGITVNANDVQLSTIAADSFFMNATGGVAVPTAVAGSTVAGAGLTYTTGGILAVGAGTGLTVNANDVQLSTIAAESFFGNFFAVPGVPAARAGNSVAGAGLTYSAGGTLAVGAGTSMTVNADDVAYTGNSAEITNATATGNLGTIDISALTCGGSYRVTAASAPFQIEGFTSKAAGFWFRFSAEDGTDQCTLFNEDATATATNRLALPNDTDVKGVALSGIFFYGGSRWNFIGDNPNVLGFGANLIDCSNGTISVASAATLTMSSSAATAASLTAGTTLTLQSTSSIVNIVHDGGGDYCYVASDDASGGFLQLEEAAASAPTVPAGRGMLWVRNDAPNVLMFTDDTNVDARVITDQDGATDTVVGVLRTATQAEQESGTAANRITTPGRQHFHPSACKCWGQSTGNTAPALGVSYNVTSITDLTNARITVNIGTDFSSANWAGVVSATVTAGQQLMVGLVSKAAGSVNFEPYNDAGAAEDPGVGFDWAFFGDL